MVMFKFATLNCQRVHPNSSPCLMLKSMANLRYPPKMTDSFLLNLDNPIDTKRLVRIPIKIP